MKELPILYSTDMVRAVLANSKTQTRRVVSPNNSTGFSCKKKELDFNEIFDNSPFGIKVRNHDGMLWRGQCKWQHGDLLWVRETFGYDGNGGIHYKADVCSPEHDAPASGWKPSIHMPKKHARIWLNVTDVCLERLRQISESDCIAEGIVAAPSPNEGLYKNYAEWHPAKWCGPLSSFGSLWCSINGMKSWDENPWVWVVKFKVVSTAGMPALTSKTALAV